MKTTSKMRKEMLERASAPELQFCGFGPECMKAVLEDFKDLEIEYRILEAQLKTAKEMISEEVARRNYVLKLFPCEEGVFTFPDGFSVDISELE